MHALKTGYNSNGLNRLRPADPEVFLQLQFKDPKGKVIDFPSGIPVIIEFDANPLKQFNTVTDDRGEVRFTADQALAGVDRNAWTGFTLLWDTPLPQYIACGMHSPPPPPFSTTDPAVAATGSPPNPNRYFSLPKQFRLRQVDVDTSVVPVHLDWDAATATLSYRNPGAQADIGTDIAPFKLILKPHWTFIRFEFFDRYYGPAAVSPPAAGHGARITPPPIGVEGFRQNADPADVDEPDVHSNWNVAAVGTNRCQCIPWFLKRDGTGNALPALLGSTMGLRFKHPAKTFIESTSSTVRQIRVVDPEPAIGATRLKYYRLPTVWKSKNYYTRNVTGGPPNAKFFNELTTIEINAANSAADALTFSLDDIVLVSANGANRDVLLLEPAHRVTLFHHQFKNVGAGYSADGIYKIGTMAADVSEEGYPFSNVDMFAASRYGGGGGNNHKFYIHDYPNWTRLVLAQGNVFDAFDERTPGTCLVVGARAAVRWVDGTTPPYGTPPVATALQSPPAGHDGRLNLRPGIVVQPANNETASFAIQTFYWQKFMTGYGAANPEVGPLNHSEWAAAYGAENDQIGRIDMVLLRCSDWAGPDETAVLLRYNRLTFDFLTPHPACSPPANPMAAVAPSPPVLPNTWIKECMDNVMARWNGNGGDIYNTANAWVKPLPGIPGPPSIRFQIVTVLQYLKWKWAHFHVKTIGTDGRSSMGEVVGSGGLRVNCTVHDDRSGAVDAWNAATSARGLAGAHELGHCGTLPDEYINSTPHSLNTPHLCLLGAPYIHETQIYNGPPPPLPTGKGMMQGNWFVRARYFWHAAEWLRLIQPFDAVNFKIDLAPERDFILPHYPHVVGSPPTHRDRHFVNWPLRVNLQATTGGITQFDAALWLLGNDRYSSAVLPNMMIGGPPGTFDGILIIMPRIQVRFTLPGGDGFKRTIRDAVFKRVSDLFTPLNFMRHAAFRPCGLGPNAPSLTRCLIHFMPCFMTEGLIANDNTPAALKNANPKHLQVNISANPDNWNAGASILTVNRPNNLDTLLAGPRNLALNGMVARIFASCLLKLGLVESPPGQFQPAQFVPLVRTVMEAGGPDPVIS